MNRIANELGNVLTAPWKERNQFVDAAFYDVGALDKQETAQLSPLVDREGSVLVVPPRGAGPLRHYANALQFITGESDPAQAVVVAGVGSSVLGAAALARNVADHYDMDVAAIVSGYGITDVIIEGLGGWFFYGAIDRAWRQIESLANNVAAAWQDVQTSTAEMCAEKSAEETPAAHGVALGLDQSTDIGTLYDILTVNPKLRLVLGHSKGNLLISFALRHFAHQMDAHSHPLDEQLTIVTLGAVVSLHDRFRRRHQFLGGLDMLGRINSQLEIPHETVPGVCHHLNPAIPMHMSVDEVLAGVALA